MTAIITLLVFCQALGAVSGAFMAVWAEIAYLRAAKDGEIDRAERAHLRVLARGLYFGMTLLLLSSLGLVIVAYLMRTATQPALTTSYWLLVLLAAIIIYVSWALSRRQITFALGSAIAFAAWWFLAYLALGLAPVLTFGAAVAFFVVAAVIFYGVIQYIRMLTRPRD